MRRAALLALLLAAPALAEELVSNKPYDDLWRASVQALVLKHFPLEVNDKNGGILRARLTSFEFGSPWFDCLQGSGKRWSSEAAVTLKISSTSDDGHKIEVTSAAKEKWVKSRMLLFVRVGHDWSDVSCESTGMLERLILEEIRENLSE